MEAADDRQLRAGLGAPDDWGGGCSVPNNGHRPESLNSNMSEEDWEVVHKKDSLARADPVEFAAGRSTSGLGLSGNFLTRAGDWLQWGFNGAVKGVEKTCDGIKGVW